MNKAAKWLIPLLLLMVGQHLIAADTPTSATKPELYYYYTPGCKKCEPTSIVVKDVEKKYSGRIVIHWRNQSEGAEVMGEYYARLTAIGMDEETPKLAVIYGDKILKDDEIIATLDTTVEALLASAAPQTSDITLSEEDKLKEAQKRSTWLFVILGGLGDGVNPCAFATVILFVSMLSTLGRARKEILAVGISFIIGVFVTYLAMGFMLYKIRDMLSAFGIVSTIIDTGAFLLVVIVGLLSLVDAVKAWRTGGKGEMLLVLPEKFKDKIRKRLRASAHSGSLVIGSFVTGVIISFLEAACTGQLYLPMINMLVKNKGTLTEGIIKLLIYNIMFILPLMGVFVAVFLGMSSDAVGNAARKRVWLTKLLLAIIFLGMGAWLGVTLIPHLINSFRSPTVEAPIKDAPAPGSLTL